MRNIIWFLFFYIVICCWNYEEYVIFDLYVRDLYGDIDGKGFLVLEML